MFEHRTRQIIQEKYLELVRQAVDVLKAIPTKQLQDVGSAYDNVWEAFTQEVQREDAVHFSSLITDVCRQMVQTLTITELQLLWLLSDGCFDWDDEDEFPEIEQIVIDVMDELSSWIEQEAEEPELEEDFDDDDDDFEVEYYEEDDSHKRKH
ncbi:hypothetical protein [Beggiatoa leptomitoformis]|uniref:Uncharacterized protein n=1 Tax=Beggiatoa leptomitoformis TaxID=288004 RepID=A0A2N9YBL4_9GAMM|nr:hypothetical protein [Beggiatoa leptomitoformis]ALG66801.1 hypothetical protein AL038_02570 [Beggiatoa leptomitoformis]AUI67851.1 hypothetical protein BLE401_03475 [Beggiatoa leptomitoformis]